MTVQVQLTTGIKDATGKALASAKTWSFKFEFSSNPPPQITYNLFMPRINR
jgi:hypothetical protein